MGNELAGREGPVIGISNSLDLFRKLKHESSRMQDGWHPYDTYNFIITSWHLFHDWPKSDDSRSRSRMKRQKKRLPIEMRLVLDVVRDIANGSKHVLLDPAPAANRRVDTVHAGLESNFYSYFFHEDCPGVTVEKNWYFSMRVLHNLVMRYFEWVFDDASSAKEFPKDLMDAILFCNIAERKGDAPKLWLLEQGPNRASDV